MDASSPIAPDMPLIHAASGAYPRYLRNIRSSGIPVSLPQIPTFGQIRQLGYYPVLPTPKPEDGVATEDAPVKQDGLYHQVWTSRPYTQEELDAQLAAIKEQYRQQANAVRINDIRQGAPYLFPDTNTTDTVPLALDDQAILISQRIAAESAVAGGITDPIFPYRTVENTIHWLTPQEMIDMTKAVLQYGEQIFIQSWAYKDALAACTSLDQVVECPTTFIQA